jgi:predicted nuclease of restriction endonuclease-like (RecB) superfamily
MRVEGAEARSYYLKEAAEQGWSVRTLERNINTFYYQRLLSSHNKPGALQDSACIGHRTLTHQDIGQMDMYRRMFDDLKKSEGDTPTIGELIEEVEREKSKFNLSDKRVL